MVRVQAMSSSVPVVIASLKDSEREEVTMLLNNASDTLVMKSLWDAIQSPGQALVVDGKLGCNDNFTITSITCYIRCEASRKTASGRCGASS